MDQFQKACKGKSLEAIWQSKEVDQAKRKLRQELQEKVNKWARQDRKRHIPVYISLKPKIKKMGSYFQKSRGNGSIVLFPIRANSFPVKNITIASKQELEATLEHEYAHHLSRDANPHGKNFQSNLRKVKGRSKRSYSKVRTRSRHYSEF